MGRIPWTSLRDLYDRGETAAVRRLIRRALLLTEGNVGHAALLLFVSRPQLYVWIRTLGMYADLDQIRRRSEHPPWLVATTAALRGETMSAWETVLNGIRGMNAEEVADSLRKSKHAAKIEDVDAFAAALVQAAEEA